MILPAMILLNQIEVESRSGSVARGSVSTFPLIEPDVRISRTTLRAVPGSRIKDSRGRSREASATLFQIHQTQYTVKVLVRELGRSPTWNLVFLAQPLTKPATRMTSHRAVGRVHIPQSKIARPTDQLRVERSHQLTDFFTQSAPPSSVAEVGNECLQLLLRRGHSQAVKFS